MSIGAAPGTERGTAPGFLADLIRNGVVLFSAGAAGIHFAVTQVHFEEWWLFGAFFLALAWFQTLWAILVVGSPHRLVFLLGALANGATVALWTVTRTAGIPVGPNAGVPEEIETVDLLSTVFEILVVLGCVLLLTRGPASRYLGGRRVLAGTLALGLVVVSLTSGAVAAWEPHHAEEQKQGGGEEPGHTEEAQVEQRQEPEVHILSLSGQRSAQAFVDPGTPGRSEVHFGFFDPSGDELPVEQARIDATQAGEDSKELEVRRLSLGHFVASVDLVAGTWRFHVEATAEEGVVLTTRFDQDIGG